MERDDSVIKFCRCFKKGDFEKDKFWTVINVFALTFKMSPLHDECTCILYYFTKPNKYIFQYLSDIPLRPTKHSSGYGAVQLIPSKMLKHMNRRMGKPTICVGENKGAVTAMLISAFVYATRIVHFLFFLNPKFQACSLLP